ncbi:TPA: phosphatidylinositol-specific phospholipase C [Bacillus mycoides]|nr:phosphatidylinositol-specific phospholipase C [Bacillus mycoides]
MKQKGAKGDYDRYRDAYAYAENIGYINKDWMGILPDNKKISELSIPGTHGSIALHGVTGADRWVINQRMTVTTQLNSGIRYLDIRARRTKTSFAMHHGEVFQKKMFGDILNEVTAFLHQNPGEIVLMRLKEEHTPEPGSQSFEDILKGYWDNPSYKNYFWQPTGSGNGSGVNANPELKDVRGKIVLLQQFDVSKAYGINYSNLEKQDHYNVIFSMDGMYAKWTAVKNHLTKANSDQNKIHLNYLSGNGGINGGAAPQFVASAYGGDGEPLMGTGSPSQYPDFPTENYKLYYGGMNILTAQYIPKLGLKHTGIIAADFPGPGLISRVINLNQFTAEDIKAAHVFHLWRFLGDSRAIDGMDFKAIDPKILKSITNYKISNEFQTKTVPRGENLPDGRFFIDTRNSGLHVGPGSYVKVHALTRTGQEVQIFEGRAPLDSPADLVRANHKFSNWKITNTSNAASGIYFEPVNAETYSYITSYKFVIKSGTKTRTINKPAPQSDGKVYLDFAQGDSSYYLQPGETAFVYAIINNGAEILLGNYAFQANEDSIADAHIFYDWFQPNPIGVYFKAMNTSITGLIKHYRVKIYNQPSDATPIHNKPVNGTILSSGHMSVPFASNGQDRGKWLKLYVIAKTDKEMLVLDRQLDY